MVKKRDGHFESDRLVFTNPTPLSPKTAAACGLFRARRLVFLTGLSSV